MSGFVALVHADGRPGEEGLIGRLTEAMAYRGPDGTATKSLDGAALGHAAFHTLEDPAEAPQPLHHGGRLWVVADARLDDRAGLIDRLAAAGHAGRAGVAGLEHQPDALLLAYAYDVWGESMVERLLGDFAFLIWDAPHRTLFGARDHMGVKPFYYASLGSDLLAGNTLESLRAHPDISERLDEHAIADFLLFGLNRHAERTSFADIRRLPPAHILSWQPGKTPHISRYWRLCVDQPIEPDSGQGYVEHFDHLFGHAVADRLRGNRAAVLMSGGLDSTAVAAVSHEVMRGRYDEFELAALTLVFERLFEDPERAYSAQVAETLGIPLHQVPLDDDLADDLWGASAAWSAEPTDLPASARTVGMMGATMPGMRVGLTGQGGDPLLHVTPADAAHRAAKDGLAATALDALRYRLTHGRLPRTGLRTHLKRRLRGRRHETPPLFPPWLRADLVERLDLRHRHQSLIAKELDQTALRPEAAFQLAGPEWSFLLEWYDPGMTGFPAEYRHPFLDLRVIEFLVGIPIVPWLVEKEILRRAMRTRLPDSVLTRRKAPLAGSHLHQSLIASGGGSLGLASDIPYLAEFIDVKRFASIAKRPERLHMWEYELVTRPLGLALWMGRLETGRPRVTEESPA